jgi:hypothetical protein
MDTPPDQPNGYRPPPSGPPADWEARRRTMQNLWTIRWVLMGLSAVIAVVLIASGAVVLGLLLAGIAIVRLLMMLMFWRRRRDVRARRDWPGPGR